MQTDFRGLGVAVVTPFDSELNVDFKALENVLDHFHASKAVDYLVVLGSTGEATALSIDEKQELLSFVKDHNKDRLPLMLGHGGNNTKVLIESLGEYDISGYQAILSVSPAYNRPTQEGIFAHYTALADAAPIPVMIYNVPSRTGSNIDAETVEQLSQHPNIFGLKDASTDLVQAMEITNRSNGDFILVSGDDMFTVPLFSVGCEGLISVLGNAYPKLYKQQIEACNSRDYKEAARLSKTTLRINKLMYKEGNPVGVKQLMAHLGLCEAYVRLPLVKASNKLAEEIKEAML